MDYELLYLMFRRSHIALGMLGVVAFWIPIVAKKGGRWHIVAGRVFEWCGYYVAGTALFACARYLLTAHDYAFIERPEASAEELTKIEFAQFFLTLLAVLALNFLSQLRIGMRVVRTRHMAVEKFCNWEATWWVYSQAIASGALMLYGTYRLATGGSSLHWLSIIVGGIILADVPKERRFLLNSRKLKMSWWYKHMECMLSCGVAFHTAGLVFTSRWLSTNWDVALPGMWQLVPWIAPAAIGVPLSQRWLKKYRTQFGDLEIRTRATA